MVYAKIRNRDCHSRGRGRIKSRIIGINATGTSSGRGERGPSRVSRQAKEQGNGAVNRTSTFGRAAGPPVSFCLFLLFISRSEWHGTFHDHKRFAAAIFSGVAPVRRDPVFRYVNAALLRRFVFRNEEISRESRLETVEYRRHSISPRPIPL